MHVLVGIAGFGIMLIILADAFETMILPRRVTRRYRLTRIFYRSSWLPWRALGRHIRTRKRREVFLSIFGPLSLIVLVIVWALGIIFAFALLQWAFGSAIAAEGMSSGFATDLYASGTTFPTLGLGDARPTSGIARFLIALEAATGFGFLALVIGYLPVLYQAFSRREANISLLDARAGSPPAALELLRRYGPPQPSAESAADLSGGELDDLLHEWEHWAAELLESHISYPVLTLFRSQHNNESWLAALTTILDTTTLLIVGIEDRQAIMDARQAQLTFAIARHAVVDLAQILQTPPRPPQPDRLPPEQLVRLRQELCHLRMPLREGADADRKLRELRAMYEPYIRALADFVFVAVPGWFPPENTPDNWQTSAWERAARRIAPPEQAVTDDHY